jgi:hypothetical protein
MNQNLDPLGLLQHSLSSQGSSHLGTGREFLMVTAIYAVHLNAVWTGHYRIFVIPGRILSNFVTTSLQTLSCTSLPFVLVTKGLAFLI